MINKLLLSLIDRFRSVEDKQFGKKGFTVIDDTTAVEGDFYAILAVGAAAVLNSAGTISHEGDSVVDNHSIADGSYLYGSFSSIQLASGTAYAYVK